MAGNYPDASSWRMAYDQDGTQVYYRDPSNVITQLSQVQVARLNNEDDNYVEFSGGRASVEEHSLVFIFPELRDFNGVYICANRDSSNSGSGNYPYPIYVESSPNTTNGLDGTWEPLIGPLNSRDLSASVKPAYRTDMMVGSKNNVKAIRIRTPGSSITAFVFRAIHIYGTIASGENPNRLAIWHPTDNVRIPPAWLDWGDAPRSSSADKTFRVHNLSASLSAKDVTVSMSALTDTTPSVPAQHYLSLDETTWLAQVNVGDISPGASSDIITIRRVTPPNAQLSLWSFRVFAEADLWEV